MNSNTPRAFSRTMLNLHTSWRELRRELVQSDPINVQKRVGGNQTLVVEIDELKYDPKIPIITEAELERWLRKRSKPSNSDDDVASHPASTSNVASTSNSGPTLESTPFSPTPIKPKAPASRQVNPPIQSSRPVSNSVPILTSASRLVTAQSSTSIPTVVANFSQTSAHVHARERSRSRSKDRCRAPSENRSKHRVKERPKKSLKSRVREIVIEPDSDEDTNVTVQEATNSNDSTSTGSNRSSKAIWECEIDSLVINEPIDDEFANLVEDDDDNETDLTRNLRKIKSVPPVQSNLNPLQPSIITEARSSQSSDLSSTDGFSKKRRTTIDDIENDQTCDEKKIELPKEPEKPNWAETLDKLKANNFDIVLKDLCHFRSHIELDESARRIPKELVMKSIQEDDTRLLIDTLQLIFELNYNNDFEFWSELVLRLKRKLNSHTNVRNYKTKTNPDWVYEIYKRAFILVGDFAKRVNLEMKLPTNTMIFLINPFPEDKLSNNGFSSDMRSKPLEILGSNSEPGVVGSAGRNDLNTSNASSTQTYSNNLTRTNGIDKKPKIELINCSQVVNSIALSAKNEVKSEMAAETRENTNTSKPNQSTQNEISDNQLDGRRILMNSIDNNGNATFRVKKSRTSNPNSAFKPRLL